MRWIDVPESVAPSQDIAALYLRKDAIAWQMRLDLLDASYQDWPDIYLAIQSDSLAEIISFELGDQNISGNLLLLVPASGETQVLAEAGARTPGLKLQVTRQTSLDAMLFSWQADALPGSSRVIQVTVCTAPPGIPRAVDCSGPISSSATPPGPARLLLAFSESLPAYTPVQALRRWDGAHTGPMGGRHGLYNLLRAARNQHIPLLLADLKALPSLAALEYLGGAALVSRMQRSGLLLAPEYLPAYPAASSVDRCQVMATSRQAVISLGLGTSQFSFAPQAATQTDNTTGILLRHEHPLLRLPASHDPDETGTDGLSIDVRRKLLQSAIQTRSGEEPVVVLGGSLPESSWGSPGPARAGMAYIANHPWLQALSTMDLFSLSPEADLSPGNGSSGRLQCNTNARISPGAIQHAVLQTYTALYGPRWPVADGYSRLEEIYLRALKTLAAVADWEAQGFELNTCPATGQSGSGQACTLASKEVLAIFDVDSAALVFLFVRQDGKVHQLITPTFQLASGMTDPSGWDFSSGLLAEAGGLPGVLLSSFVPEQYAIRDSEISFINAQAELRYQLTKHGIKIDVLSGRPESLHISLGLDPWHMVTPDWVTNYSGSIYSAGYAWMLSPQLSIQVTTNGSLQAAAFNDTMHWIGITEDPNRETPAGHFLPFPLAQVTVRGSFELGTLVELALP